MEKSEVFKVIFSLVVNFVNLIPKDKEFGEMTTNEFYLFLFINFHNPVTMKECSQKLRLSKSTITVLIDKLENKGIILRERSNTDRRKIYLVPTKKGKRLFSRISGYFSSIIDTVTAKIPKDKIEIINKGFEYFIKSLEVEK
ncbi:MarR family transcriptional regulator [Thermosipho ferrireducens]|uniref:MarR family transcriptional regulator n=1 Tax=Thermosipho ferrireducens TaxID=2571116 RepID=A0ABX7S9T1_9BACT|nr:MarR family transcriptional regulator [Thermosipho ferrireducens]QTA38645.1 MarR family transcriptional regulator [Thermosipho ferrireducens]